MKGAILGCSLFLRAAGGDYSRTGQSNPARAKRSRPAGGPYGGEVAVGVKIGIFGGVLLVYAVYGEFCRSPLVLTAEIENLG